MDWPNDTLTPRQQEVLRDVPYDDWVRPMDIGASDGSHHSETLRALVLKGWVQRRGYGSYKYKRAPDPRVLLGFVRQFASYGCVEQDPIIVCGRCGPCEASAYLKKIGER